MIIKECDIITLNIPYSIKNKNFIDEKKINNMKKNATIVNCSRGGLIDEKALYKKLKRNKKQLEIAINLLESEEV